MLPWVLGICSLAEGGNHIPVVETGQPLRFAMLSKSARDYSLRPQMTHIWILRG
ncbi:hypothetical protein ABG768_012804, partial [Culter alburnus]